MPQKQRLEARFLHLSMQRRYSMDNAMGKREFVLAAIALILFFSLPSARAENITTSIYAYYKLDGDGTDSTNNSQHLGEIQGCASASGKISSSMDCTGQSDSHMRPSYTTTTGPQSV